MKMNSIKKSRCLVEKEKEFHCLACFVDRKIVFSLIQVTMEVHKFAFVASLAVCQVCVLVESPLMSLNKWNMFGRQRIIGAIATRRHRLRYYQRSNLHATDVCCCWEPWSSSHVVDRESWEFSQQPQLIQSMSDENFAHFWKLQILVISENQRLRFRVTTHGSAYTSCVWSWNC